MTLTLCKRLLSLLFVVIVLAGCGPNTNLAPVSELKWHPYNRYPNTHVVTRGETLYAIAFRYDTDYRRLARINRLKAPYPVHVGQVLKIKGAVNTPQKPKVKPKVRTVSKGISSTSLRKTKPAAFSPRPSSGWLWPASGRVVTGFLPTQGKKGINIACTKGEKVRAASSGVVAYAGSGLAGYGNLIIIKHNKEYLTAYGNNAKNLVSEGQRVTSGQVIAEVGLLKRKFYGVHFEIRKAGKPVNPLSYLKRA